MVVIDGDYVIFFAAASIDRRRGRTQQHQHNQIIQMGDKAVRCEMSVNTAYTTFKLEVSLSLLESEQKGATSVKNY